ncbi:MAG: tetratricopeptide repeat protein, partial [Deltaproteobacteria bacterium]|nr:tetratricopeptide repeat protein [Deltaproteobacteria bacterium]
AFVTARNSKDPEKLFAVGSKLVRAYPNSKKISDVLSTMGKIALDSLQFARGASFLEAAARRKRGGDAAKIYKASGEIRAQLGDRIRAERNLNVLLRIGTSAAEKAHLATSIAQLHIQAGDWRAVIGLLKRASVAGASSPKLSYMLGYALFRDGQLATAQGYLSQAVSGGQGGGDTAKDAAAAAQFYLAEISFAAFKQVQLSSDLSQLGTTLQQKLGFLQATRQAYTAVGSLGSAVWTVAALGRLANVDENAAIALRSLKLPTGIPEAVAKQVHSALEGNAAPLAKESKLAIKQCAATAKKLKVLSAAAKACLAMRAPAGDPQANLVVPSVNRSRPEGATKLQRRLALRPNDLPAIRKLGRLYLRQGNPYMARMILGKGTEVKETAPLLNAIGVATARLGDFQGAYTYFERALKKESDFAFAQANKAYLLSRFGYRNASRAVAKHIANRAALTEGDPALLSGALAAIGAN